MYGRPPPRRQEGCSGMWKAEPDRTDTRAAEREQPIDNLPPWHHIGPISSASLINHQRTEASLKLSPSTRCCSQPVRPLSLVCLYLFSPSPLHRSLGHVCVESDSGLSILVLLSLLQHKPFTCANRCPAHFIHRHRQ